jgi:nucleoside-diphosphate-sugar epimerase
MDKDELIKADKLTEKDKDFKKCLVIGGAGMLGFEIAKQLYEDGKEVSILDLVPFNDIRFKGYVGDIRRPVPVQTVQAILMLFSRRPLQYGIQKLLLRFTMK